MTKKEPSLRRTLRALRGGDHPDEVDETPVPAAPPEPRGDVIDELEDAVTSLEAKLASGEGIDGLAGWLREVEAAVTALNDAELDTTRDDLRSLIDRLLGINAEIQNVVRLKKLLS
jgi:hypothetical protein